MLSRVARQLTHNLLAVLALCSGIALVPGCKLWSDWDQLSKPSTAQAPIESSPAWHQAIVAGKAADATSAAAGVAAYIPGAAPIVTPIGNSADAFSAYLWSQLQELKDRQAKSEAHLSDAPTQLDVYKAVAGAALAGAGGAFVRRRRATDTPTAAPAAP